MKHEVTERPILFNGQMVPPVLADIKTQTRRALRVQPTSHHWESLPGYELKRARPVTIDGRYAVKFYHSIPQNRTWDKASDWLLCPYGEPGSRLWVRETWAQPEKRADNLPAWVYAADWPASVRPDHRWRPSIHMPRAASRITLEITDVRVERLQDISRGDAMAEGCPFPNMAAGPDPRQWYAELWDQINGSGSWDFNPWVWCVTFKRIKP